LGLAIAFYFFVGLVPLLVISALLAYLLWPIVNFVDAHVLGAFGIRWRSMAVLLTFIGLITSIVAGIILILPVLVGQVSHLGERLPEIIEDVEVEIRQVLSRPLAFGGTPILIDGEPIVPIDRLEQITTTDPLNALVSDGEFDIFATIGNVLTSIGAPAFSVLGGAINVIFNLTFIIVIMFYLMRDGEIFVGHIISITPKAYQGDMRRLFYELSHVWNAYLRGQLILCVSIGVAVYIAALILGLPGAPMLGLIAAFLEFIPNVGPTLATIPAVIVAVLSTSSTFPFLSGIPFALAVMATWALIQQLEAIYLTPRVMGGGLDLHPLVVIIALLAGAYIGGAIGVILAAPFMATARVFGQYFYGKLFDVDPFPNPKPYEVDVHKPRLLRAVDYFKRYFMESPINNESKGT
jgi:predicted PurR-regulated permease PerM